MLNRYAKLQNKQTNIFPNIFPAEPAVTHETHEVKWRPAVLSDVFNHEFIVSPL